MCVLSPCKSSSNFPSVSTFLQSACFACPVANLHLNYLQHWHGYTGRCLVLGSCKSLSILSSSSTQSYRHGLTAAYGLTIGYFWNNFCIQFQTSTLLDQDKRIKPILQPNWPHRRVCWWYLQPPPTPASFLVSIITTNTHHLRDFPPTTTTATMQEFLDLVLI